MSPHYRPWTCQGKKLYNVPKTERVQEAIDIAWGSHSQRCVADDKRFPFYQDVSQCVSRHTWGSSVPCITRSSLVYDFKRDQILSSKALLAMQGLPVPDMKLDSLPDVSEADLRDLAGECMFLPSLGSILLAVFLNRDAVWWCPAGDSYHSDLGV